MALARQMVIQVSKKVRSVALGLRIKSHPWAASIWHPVGRLVVRADLHADAPAVVLHALHGVGAGVVVGGFSEPRFIGDVHFAVPKLLPAVVVPEDRGVEATTVLRLLDRSTQQSDFGGSSCCGLPGLPRTACGFGVVRRRAGGGGHPGLGGTFGEQGQGGTLGMGLMKNCRQVG